ncbi:RecX family transcriptional regulator [Peptostreptococcaceae bacterium OttesenSCG-928-C18]|nr:RecX family transcriptional regulator [Peptostreptococcaceae bacterium OttesenSCG-928-C18]
MIIKELIYNSTANYFKITTDDNSVFFADYNLYNILNLSVELELSKENIKLLESFTNKQKLLSKILNFISYRNRTEKEIRDRLKKESKDEIIIEDIILHLKKQGFIDDISFLKSYYENKRRLNHWSSNKIKYELNLKGIKNIDFNNYFDDVYEMDYNNAKFFLEKKINNWTDKYEKYQVKNKIYVFLSQKGFNYDVISAVTEDYYD